MKKIVCLVLAMVICLSLCACSVSSEDIVGVWDGGYSNRGNDFDKTIFIEEGGTYKTFTFKNGEFYEEEAGHYEIHGNEVQLHFDGGYTPLEYKDGKLTSPKSSYVQCEYLKVSKGEDTYSAYINKNYMTYLADKVFEYEGRTLTFDGDFCVTYHFGDYIYTYSIEEFEVDDNSITMQIKLKEASRYDDIIDENELKEMKYKISTDTVKYYVLTYNRVS